MLIWYFAAWFVTTSILARFKHSWYSSEWMLNAAWVTAFFRIFSSRSLTCWIFCSSSWYLLCSSSMNNSCSGIASSLCSVVTWHMLYVTSTPLQYSVQAPLVFLTVFLNSSAVFIAKGNSSSYNILSQIYLEKSLYLYLSLLYLYKKEKLLDYPKMTFGLP